MHINTGTVQTEKEWRDDFNEMTCEEWGSKEFDESLVDVEYKNGEWVEV